jgi:uncharacterized protein
MTTIRLEARNPGLIESDVTDDWWVTDRNREPRASDSGATAGALEPWVVDLLVCPVDRGPVRLHQSDLVCIQCGRRYPVLAGIPRMIPDQDAGEQKF